jgi:hypothetical protein
MSYKSVRITSEVNVLNIVESRISRSTRRFLECQNHHDEVPHVDPEVENSGAMNIDRIRRFETKFMFACYADIIWC